MNRNTWKQGERRIARMFGSERTPLSGGNSKHTRSDSLHDKLFIEIKHRKNQVAEKIWNEVKENAKTEKKIPLIILIKKNHPEPLILCRLSDVKKIGEELR